MSTIRLVAFRYLIFILIPFCGPQAAQGMENYFNATSLTLQQGHGFEVGGASRDIATLEHASAWNWGDLFAFYDRIREKDGGKLSYYGELSPRFSLSLLGLDTDFGIVRDVLLATTFERGSNGFRANLAGPGLTWNLPPFTHLSSNLYYRDTVGLAGATWQLTVAWTLPFNTGPLQWYFNGYMDLRAAEGSAVSDLNVNPQLKLDLGQAFGAPNRFFAGVEYYHWNNKYGIEGVNERVLSPLLQVRMSL